MITVKELRLKLAAFPDDLYVTAIRDVLCIGWKNPDDGTLMIDNEIDVPNQPALVGFEPITYRGISVAPNKEIPDGEAVLIDGEKKEMRIFKI